MLFTDSILNTLRMGELNHHINGRKVHLKPFPGSKANQLNHHTIPILEEHQCDAAAIHVGINDLLKGMPNNVCVDSICNDILEIALRCRNHNIGEVFISSVAYSSKVSNELIQQLNNLLQKRCIEYGYSFINNGVVSKIDLWTGEIHLPDSGKTKIANNVRSSFNYFLGAVIPNSRSHQGKAKILFILTIVAIKDQVLKVWLLTMNQVTNLMGP